MKEVIKYKTEDNCVFDTKEKAIQHEIFLSYGLENLKNDINDFLKEKDNYNEWIKNYWKNCKKEEESNTEFHFCASVSKSIQNNYNITIYDTEESEIELDENFNIDMDKWYELKEDINLRFGINIIEPIHYWPK